MKFSHLASKVIVKGVVNDKVSEISYVAEDDHAEMVEVSEESCSLVDEESEPNNEDLR